MTDFSTWDRTTLERLARELLTENKQLKADVQTLLATWRNEIMKAQK